MSKKTASQWPGALLFLSGSLKTGLTLEKAIEALAQEAPEPLRSELRARVGAGSKNEPVERCIERLLQGPHLALARAALLLSHRVGGQAGRLLEESAAQLQGKLEMSEKIKALSAEGVASAWVVGLSPFALLLLLCFLAPEYASPLFNTAAGRWTLCLVALMVAVGLHWVRKIAGSQTE